MDLMDQIREAYLFIHERYRKAPQYGIILGTGLGGLIDDLEVEKTVPYTDIPHFPIATVETHSGQLIFGKLAGKSVVVMRGRFHYYEGYSMEQVTFPVRVMKMLGIEKLFISNAAGGLNPNYQKSDIMVIEDHINLQPENPLTGPNLNQLGPRFPDMSQPYDRSLIDLAHKVGKQEGLPFQKGVYASVSGPNLETKAEYRFLRTIGADAVGMSTVPEVIVAKHASLPVFAVSAITDLCYGELEPVSIESVIAAANQAEPKMRRLIRKMIEAL